MDADDIHPEALAGAAVGAALTAAAMNPKVRRAVRSGAVWALGRLLALKDAAHAAVKGLAQEAALPPAAADRAADLAADAAGSAATTAVTP